jgi:hypothetical protein
MQAVSTQEDELRSVKVQIEASEGILEPHKEEAAAAEITTMQLGHNCETYQ